MSSGVAYDQIEKEVTLPILVSIENRRLCSGILIFVRILFLLDQQSQITHMKSQNKDVRQNVLSFVNALLSKAEPNRRRHLASTLNSRQYRSIVLKSIVSIMHKHNWKIPYI